MDYPIRPVRGNWFRLHHPLEKVVWIESNKTIVDYIPAEGDKLTVTLQGAYTPYEMENVTIEGNVLKYENNGTLPCGLYDVVINVVLADGKRLRSHQDGIVKVVKTNKEASIPDYVEFGIDTYVLDGAVFMYVPDGESDLSNYYTKEEADELFLQSETDPTVPTWAKQPNKPTYTASEVGALPSTTPIPSEVTESTVAGWGFTKNTGTYSKPSTGIPKTDLSQGVQDSLGLADSALQDQVQADWNEADTTKPSFINHKPSIPSASDTTPLMDGVGGAGSSSNFARADHRHPSDTTKQDVINDLADIRSGASKGNTAYQKPSSGIPKTDLASDVQTSLGKADNAIQKSSSSTGLLKPNGDVDNSTYLTQHQDISGKANTSDLSDVAFSGDYDDLENKPTIPTLPTLATVATSGSYNDLLNKPTIPTVPTNVSSFNNDAGYLTSHQDISGKEDKFTIVGTHKTSGFEASVGNYYFVDIAASGSLSIQLATPSDNTKLSSCVFFLTTNTSPALDFAAETDVPVYYAANYKIEASKVYEINALYNGESWCIAQVEMEVQS